MRKLFFKCRNFKLSLTRKTLVMGVINVTPDSFSDGGKYYSHEAAYKLGLKMQQDGADIVDIGGESTRPGAETVPAEEELKRVIPVIKRLSKKLKIPISIDTRKHVVAKEALLGGASIINDITGLLGDTAIAEVASKYKAGVIIMHIKGTPRTMQSYPRYKCLIPEMCQKLKLGISLALRAGVDKHNIVIDPGIGFGKTVRHNLEIINNLYRFKQLNYPVMIGLSKKSFIGKTLNLPVNERLIPTVAANAIAVARGADMLRVHDVKEAVWTRDIAAAIVSSSNEITSY